MVSPEVYAEEPAPLEEIPLLATYLRALETGQAALPPPDYEGSVDAYRNQLTERVRQRLERGIDIATGQLVMARSIGEDDANLIIVGTPFTRIAEKDDKMYSDRRVALAIGECLGLAKEAEHCIVLRARHWTFRPVLQHYLVHLDNPITGQPCVSLQYPRQLRRGPRLRTSSRS